MRPEIVWAVADVKSSAFFAKSGSVAGGGGESGALVSRPRPGRRSATAKALSGVSGCLFPSVAAAADGDDLGEDREGDFLRADRAEIEPGR